MRMLVAALLLLLSATLPARAADPFHAGKPSEVPALLAVPFGGRIIASAARAQRDLNAALSTRFHAVGTTGSATAIATILLLSFAYGVLHAIGPGHGKVVVASYFVARRERWAKSIVFGSLISLIQGVSAVVIVGTLGLAFRLAQVEVLGEAAVVEVVSYGLIALLGLWMLYQAVTGRAHCHSHGHEHGSHDHGADHRPRITAPALVLTAGFTPCASAIIVLLFALANSVFVVGIAAALAMSVGMAITVSGIGVLSVLSRHVAQLLFGGTASWAARLERVLAIGGPLLLVGVSMILFLGAWSQL